MMKSSTAKNMYTDCWYVSQIFLTNKKNEIRTVQLFLEGFEFTGLNKIKEDIIFVSASKSKMGNFLCYMYFTI